MYFLIPILNVLSICRVSVLSFTIFMLVKGLLGSPIPSIDLWLNISLFFIILHMITEVIRIHFIKHTSMISTIFLAGFWVFFIKSANLSIFVIDNTYQLQAFLCSISIAMLSIYLYQNLRNIFNVFSNIKISYRLLITLSFLLVIAVGTLLLLLPVATRPGVPPLSLIDAFFTAVSAVCVTGLIVVDTATHFSRFGHSVIMGLVQIGSLGLVTITTTMVALLGRKLSLTGQISAKNSISASSENSLADYLSFTLGFTIIVELVIALVLFIRFHQTLPLSDALFYAIFHAVTAFCNAGFALFSDSLMGFQSDILINMVIMLSIIVGGLGFRVWLDLKSRYIDHTTKHLTLQTKVVTQTSLNLILIGAISFFIFERNNVLADLSLFDQILSSFFASVNLRTAGFNTVDLSKTNEASRLFSLLLMYIGASPGSTGGGIKTTTFLVISSYIKASLNNNQDVIVFGRRVDQSLVHQAWTLVFNSFFWIFFVSLGLCFFDQLSLSDSLYETFSAYATVGVSTGVTGSLSDISKFLLCTTMILGRIGPTTVMLALSNKTKTSFIRTPAEKLSIG